eukprot:1161638-Pelagomonas_calceolata.AAC.1
MGVCRDESVLQSATDQRADSVKSRGGRGGNREHSAPATTSPPATVIYRNNKVTLIGMDGCSNERLLYQCIQVPGNISRAIPDWLFPYGTGSPARHQSRPDALFVRPIPGRQATLIPPRSLLRTGTSTSLE